MTLRGLVTDRLRAVRDVGRLRNLRELWLIVRCWLDEYEFTADRPLKRRSRNHGEQDDPPKRTKLLEPRFFCGGSCALWIAFGFSVRRVSRLFAVIVAVVHLDGWALSQVFMAQLILNRH